MRVNRNRLDLRSLILNTSCTITTGDASIKIVHSREAIDMGIRLKGSGPMKAFDRVSSIEDEHGKSFFTEWLHLDALAPRRLYVVKVTRVEKNGRVGWQLEDATPGQADEPKQDRTKPWGVVRKIFGKGSRDG